jgi:thymidylate kinase
MKIVIFEGIATSGKSTTINKLVESLSANNNVIVVDESETHEPIMNERSEPHAKFFTDLITRYVERQADVLIFDRLYLTQAHRASIGLNEYKNIEEQLLKHSPITIFLQVDETAIAERIKSTMQLRNAEWADYVKTRGESADDIAQYYIDQQKSQLALLGKSQILYKICNSTDHDYERIKNEIIQLLKKL